MPGSQNLGCQFENRDNCQDQFTVKFWIQDVYVYITLAMDYICQNTKQ